MHIDMIVLVIVEVNRAVLVLPGSILNIHMLLVEAEPTFQMSASREYTFEARMLTWNLGTLPDLQFHANSGLSILHMPLNLGSRHITYPPSHSFRR